MSGPFTTITVRQFQFMQDVITAAEAVINADCNCSQECDYHTETERTLRDAIAAYRKFPHG